MFPDMTKAHLPPKPCLRRAVKGTVVISLSLSPTKCPAGSSCGKSKIPDIVFVFLGGREAHPWESPACGRSIYLPSRVCIFNQNQFISFLGLPGRPNEADEVEMTIVFYI